VRNHLESTGNWLFQRRSYLPIIFFAFIIISLRDFHSPFGKDKLAQLWDVFCLTISLSGLVIRIMTIGYVPDGTSGRNTKGQKACELNTTGMGVTMFARVWWLVIIMSLSYWLYYERIIFAEEEFLRRKFGQGYIDWAKKTRIFLPKFSTWKKPARPFSLRMVLKREYSTVFLIILLFFAMVEAASLFTSGSPDWDPMWLILLAVSLIQYVLFRTLKKHTMLLRNPD